MNDEEKEIIKLTVEGAVEKGNQPLWKKLSEHDTAIALNQQELKQGMDSQIAQGKRIGTLETETTVMKTKIKAHLWWIFGILSIAGAVVWVIVKALLTEV